MPLSIEVLGIGENEEDVEHIGNDRKQKNRSIGALIEDQESGNQGGNGGAPLRPGTGMSVIIGFLVLPPIEPEVIENHRLMRAGTKGVTKCIGSHCKQEDFKAVGEIKGYEGENVSEEGEHHRQPSAYAVCKNSRRNFREINQHLACRIEGPYF